MYSPREAQKDFLYVKHAYMFIAITIGVIAMAFSHRGGVQYFLLKFISETTVATVTETPFINGRTLKFDFVDLDGFRRSGSSFATPASTYNVEVGSTVKISYSLITPDVSEWVPAIDKYWPEFVFFAGGFSFVFFGSAFSLFNVIAILKHRQKDKFY